MEISREQFEKLALSELDTLYRVARRLTGDTHRAEDLVQETYVRAVGAFQRFSLKEFGIRPWLLRILHNVHISRGEREDRQPRSVEREMLDEVAPEGPVGLPIDPASPDAMDERLVAALDALPLDYKVVMMHWAVDELSYKEIAGVLDIPIGTVMSRLHRARQKLAERLGPPEYRQNVEGCSRG